MWHVESFCGCVKLDAFANFYGKLGVSLGTVVAVLFAFEMIMFRIEGGE